jgi:hypothetical protein
MGKQSAATVRGNLVTLMDLTAKNEPRWHYRMVRPLTLPTRVQAVSGTVYSDCSFGCSILCKLAGAADPTGANWQGNSSSMFHHLPHLAFSQVKNGDIAVFGHNDGELHAVMVYKKAATVGGTLCWSHGQERGPILVPLSVEIAFHKATMTFLRTVPPDPKPKTIVFGVKRRTFDNSGIRTDMTYEEPKKAA